MKTYYRTIFTYEVLSEEPLPDCTLEDLHYLTSEGGCSGHFVKVDTKEVNADAMRYLLRRHGADPELFQLGEKRTSFSVILPDGRKFRVDRPYNSALENMMSVDDDVCNGAASGFMCCRYNGHAGAHVAFGFGACAVFPR